MNKIIEKQWVQPTLTANGTLGGSSFAVSCKDFASNDSSNAAACDAYCAFSSDESKYWRSKTSTSYIIFYNPVPIKIKSIYCRTNINTTTKQSFGAPESGTIYGSNDGSTWTTIKKFTNTKTGAFSVAVGSTMFYKYHKFEGTCTKNDSYLHLHFRIDAVYQATVSGAVDLSSNTGKVTSSDITQLTGNSASMNTSTGSKVTYTKPTSVSKIVSVNYTDLRKALSNMYTAFNGNCCQSYNNNCCETCQGCQACQTCQSSSCQSQTCQTSKCQSCQGCQSCQSQSCQSYSECNCNCNCMSH